MAAGDVHSESGLSRPPLIGVIGAGKADEKLRGLAGSVGRLAALRGWPVICGGLGGVMEAASRGASEAGGTVIGLLPGETGSEANPYVTFALPTGLGHGRNVLIARAADALIAVGGDYGTLSEIALGVTMGKPVYSLDSWAPDGRVVIVRTPEEALAGVEEALISVKRKER